MGAAGAEVKTLVSADLEREATYIKYFFVLDFRQQNCK
jgi:hypothetical protein